MLQRLKARPWLALGTVCVAIVAGTLLWFVMRGPTQESGTPDADAGSSIGAGATGEDAVTGSGRRIALVIGNGNYGGRLPQLSNPVNDASLMATSLREVGFEVEELTDIDRKSMKQALTEFREKLEAAGKSAVGLFFFAGHGLQHDNDNWLIPAKAEIEGLADLEEEAIRVNYVLNQMRDAGNGVNIMFLDACRDSGGFVRSTGGRGLAPPSASLSGAYIAYATAPGKTAADGIDANSPFTKALAQQIRSNGATIEEIMKKVRAQVFQATNGRQEPWDSSSLRVDFYFKAQSAEPAPSPDPGASDNLVIRDKDVIAGETDGSRFQIKATQTQEFANSIPTIVIKGELINKTDMELGAPNVWISVRDRNKRELHHWIVKADQEQVSPRGMSSFSARLENPPADAIELEIRVARDGEQ